MGAALLVVGRVTTTRGSPAINAVIVFAISVLGFSPGRRIAVTRTASTDVLVDVLVSGLSVTLQRAGSTFDAVLDRKEHRSTPKKWFVVARHG